MITEGSVIGGRYEILEKIGSGGMSDVYKAKDQTLGRFVAIKVLKQEFAQDSTFVSKFRTEAQSAAGLQHANIVNVYDVGSQDKDYYIVMEYVEGVTLKKYIEAKGKLNYKETLSIAIQVARGIQAAHAKGIIHRDIKPQNIMISADGKVKVMDFGIARAASSATSTISSDAMGSVHYSSPEQVRNGYISNKSDIYSLGIVMYEMVTGRVPFDGDSTVSVAIKHLQEEITSPKEYAEDLPVSLEKIILKCTQKSPDRRYASIDDLLTDLKKSLVSPYEDFVVIDSPVDDKTRVISEEELEEIQENSGGKEGSEEESGEEENKEDEDKDEEEEEDEGKGFLNKKMEKIITIMGIVAAVVIVIIVIYIIGNLTGVFNFSGWRNNDDEETSEEAAETVEVPDLLGLTYSAAEDELEDLGLEISKSGTEESDEYEAGEIISQNPGEGEYVEAGSTVSVVICAEDETVEVPDVVGDTASTAEGKIEDAGLVASRQYEYSSSVASGYVIEQSPSAGNSVDSGTTVTITVSQGEETVTTEVPDLSGMSESSAKSALSSAGLSTGTVSSEYSDSVEEGCVISQSPSAGSTVEEGESVDFVVSLGAEDPVYALKTSISAPTNYEVTSADITLLSSSGAVLWSQSGVTSFPYTVTVTDITGASSGTLSITWYYTDSNGESQTSVQEASVTFTQTN